ncbi:MAG TPA: GyrI-like domain-containing protein [Hyphomicrobiaceae bacterium]|nr:GyrI-like domain-containing protein [Hyphomicrobiaceae bacterium]
MRVTYRYIRPCVVLYARGIGSYATSVAAAWKTMHGWLEAGNVRHLFRRGLGIFHDDPSVTAADALRYDACIPPIDGVTDGDPEAGIGRQTLAGGAYAVYAHVGPYENTGEAFSKMRRITVVKRGLSIDVGRPFVAIYLNDPQVTREVHRRTELCVPVMPMRMPLSSNDDVEHLDIARTLAHRQRA